MLERRRWWGGSDAGTEDGGGGSSLGHAEGGVEGGTAMGGDSGSFADNCKVDSYPMACGNNGLPPVRRDRCQVFDYRNPPPGCVVNPYNPASEYCCAN